MRSQNFLDNIYSPIVIDETARTKEFSINVRKGNKCKHISKLLNDSLSHVSTIIIMRLTEIIQPYAIQSLSLDPI